MGSGYHLNKFGLGESTGTVTLKFAEFHALSSTVDILQKDAAYTEVTASVLSSLHGQPALWKVSPERKSVVGFQPGAEVTWNGTRWVAR